jgi:hypothetical protein
MRFNIKDVFEIAGPNVAVMRFTPGESQHMGSERAFPQEDSEFAHMRCTGSRSHFNARISLRQRGADGRYT